MDIISHGLWGSIAVGRKNKKQFWLSFLFGILPDLFSFGIFSAFTILGLSSGPDWNNGPPDMHIIPSFVSHLYNVTHSLVIFVLVFGLVWLVRKKTFLPLLAWGLHVLVDIPSHSFKFFPTPFLWPISDFAVNGVSWGSPYIFYPNVILLAVCYVGWWVLRKKDKKT